MIHMIMGNIISCILFQYSIEFEYFPWNISSWRNEKATFKEKLVEIATEKVKGKNEGYYDEWESTHGS